jgi:hypothetical protein
MLFDAGIKTAKTSYSTAKKAWKEKREDMVGGNEEGKG